MNNIPNFFSIKNILTTKKMATSKIVVKKPIPRSSTASQPQAEFSYKEPDYTHIIKREYYDEDNHSLIVKDEFYNKKDRSRLQQFGKSRVSAGCHNVKYVFGSGCESLKLGRLFPENSMGLQSFRFDMRNPLAQKYYWDIDVENAHYRIALKYCQDLGLSCQYIESYIEYRNEWLEAVSSDRKIAKTEFLKTLYLGNIKAYSDEYDDLNSSDITEEGHNFLKGLNAEVLVLAHTLWQINSHLHNLKSGGKLLKNKPNPQASLMSLLFQTEERKMLMVLDQFLTFKGRYMGVYIHDGGLVEKFEGEKEFPPELLIQGAEAIKKWTGYEVVLTQKEIKYEWTPKRQDDEGAYARMKQEFEKHTFVVGTMIYNITEDGKTELLKPNEAEFKFKPAKVKVRDPAKNRLVEKSFYKVWIDDPDRLEYDRLDFMPDASECPPNVYNLFNGFKAEEYRPAKALSEEEINKNVEPIIKHINYLTKNNPEPLLKWLSHIVQHPYRKTEMALLFRDEGNFLQEGGGTGKNMFIEFFGFEILGEKYCWVVHNNEDLYAPFNSQQECKLLVFVEEADGRDNFKQSNVLKSMITRTKLNVNAKHVRQYTVNDYANYIFTTNNRNPLPIVHGSRRYYVFDTDPCMRGNVEYFTKLASILNNDTVKWSFYQYLLNYKTVKSPIEFMQIPVTDAYRDIRRNNAPAHLIWLAEMILDYSLEDGSINRLYKKFVAWYKQNISEKDTVMSLKSFGSLLGKSDSIMRKDASVDDNSDDEQGYDMPVLGIKKKSSSIVMQWDKEAVIKGLKRLYLLPEDF